jgi:tetraprenyl-beta-curcumene synthase
VGRLALALSPSDRWLSIRAHLALLVANARYWPTVSSVVHSELRRWEAEARRIPNPTLKALALEKLHDEHFNAEVAATLCVLSPRARRRTAIEAIVAFEVMYDYLDGLTEQSAPDPLRNARELFRAFTDAVRPARAGGRNYYVHSPQGGDGGYLERLGETVKSAIAQLPSITAIEEVARRSAERCAEAQARVHADQRTDSADLERWARRAALDAGLDWRVFLGGAVASVLCVHALIATAAGRSLTTKEAAELDSAYLLISALSTMLDSLTDFEQDALSGGAWYIDRWQDPRLFAHELASTARRAVEQARELPQGAHHVMTLVGVVAYYTSAPSAEGPVAAPLVAAVHRELRPLMGATLLVMRAWRRAKRLRRRLRGGHRELGSEREPGT